MKRSGAAAAPVASSHNGSPNSVQLGPADPDHERYPVSIVWTPIPLITWILPFVGHMGICDSKGIIHDFAGPYYIGEDCLAFGNPAKYWRIDTYIAKSNGGKLPFAAGEATGVSRLELVQNTDGGSTIEGEGALKAVQRYDEGIYRMRDHFRATQNYNFFCNNCHTYCAYSLEQSGVGGTTWNMVKLAAAVFFFGKYVSFGRFLAAHGPFFVLCGIIAVIAGVTS